MRFQSNLGEVAKKARTDINMSGYITLGRVIEVHHKHNTADVMIVNTKDTLVGSPLNEGRFSCKILSSNAHYDEDTGLSWGVIEPISKEDLVIVAFLENNKSQPVILKSLHRLDGTNSIMPKNYPVYEAKDVLKFLRVFPSQNYFKALGNGDIELTFVGKSFISVGENISDSHGSTDFSSLSEKDPRTGKTRQVTGENGDNTDISAKVFMPDPSVKKFLAVFRDSLDDSATSWLKLFYDSGMFRATKDNNDGKLSYMELQKNGALRIRRQLDSNGFGQGTDYSEIIVGDSGKISVTRVGSFGKLELSVSNGSFSLTKDSDCVIAITPSGDLTITARNIVLKNKNNPNSYVNITSSGVDVGNP